MTTLYRLLFFDLLGALGTTLLTWFVLASEVLPTGLPPKLLYSMAITAGGFACFDFIALLCKLQPTIALKVIAFLNFAYGVGSLLICVIYLQSITLWGLLYFGGEIPILIVLAWIEWTLASRTQPI